MMIFFSVHKFKASYDFSTYDFFGFIFGDAIKINCDVIVKGECCVHTPQHQMGIRCKYSKVDSFRSLHMFK